MIVYSLTPLGRMLASSIRPNIRDDRSKTRWAVIYYLGKNGGVKDRDSIVTNTGATSYTLAFLVGKKILNSNEGVVV